MLALGDPRPQPEAADPDDIVTALAPGTASLVLFLCNHCPYVKHVGLRLGELAREWQAAGVRVVGVNPNARTHPGDLPARMPHWAATHGWSFPYVADEDQALARRFGAVSTPDPFLFDARGILVYRGQFDGTRPGGAAATGADLDAAVRATLARAPVPSRMLPSAGCAIKWLE